LRRGILREFGVAIGVGALTALARIPASLEDASVELPGLVRQAVWLLVEDVRALDARIAAADRELAACGLPED
jgi:transposase